MMNTTDRFLIRIDWEADRVYLDADVEIAGESVFVLTAPWTEMRVTAAPGAQVISGDHGAFDLHAVVSKAQSTGLRSFDMAAFRP